MQCLVVFPSQNHLRRMLIVRCHRSWVNFIYNEMNCEVQDSLDLQKLRIGPQSFYVLRESLQKEFVSQNDMSLAKVLDRYGNPREGE